MNKSKTTNSYLLYVGAVIVVIGLMIFAVNQKQSVPTIYDDFAQCLTDQGFEMYGAWWCSHCKEQKEAFGNAFEKINYIECSPSGTKEMAPECEEAGIEGYPTWITGEGEQMQGQIPLEVLASSSGCELPEEHK